jgi:hypothetical protein
MTKLIKQANRPGLYVSDIINERYQILESEVFKSSYFVYDLVKDDMIRSNDGSCKYFDSLDSAMAVATGLGMVAKAVKVKQPKPEKIKEPKAAGKRDELQAAGRPKPKKGSANGTIIELIKTTQMTDAEISAEVMRLFPDCKTCKPYDVKYRRRKVEAGAL